MAQTLTTTLRRILDPLMARRLALPGALYQRLPTLNPLVVGRAVLPLPVLLLAKLLTVVALLSIWPSLPAPFLPFVPLFGQLGAPDLVQRAFQIVFLVAAVALLMNLSVRTACLTMGTVVLLALFSDRGFFANNTFFAGCILLLAGLTVPGRRPRLLQLQVALLYLGAGFNKLLSVDWRSGQFFANWMKGIPDYWRQSLLHGMAHDMLLHVSAWLPPGLLWLLLGWCTIAVELSLGVGFLVRRFNRIAIVVGLCFHTALLVLTGRTYGFFYWAPISYLAFVEWPPAPCTMLYDGARGFCDATRRFFERIDFDHLVTWVPSQRISPEALPAGVTASALLERAYLVMGRRVYGGFAAFKWLLAYLPITYFLVLSLLLLAHGNGELRPVVAVLLLLLASPLFTPVGNAGYALIARHRHRLSGTRCEFSPALRSPDPNSFTPDV
ncbi:MAG: thiol-disulfide oxidoreductase DCC family protein [Ktedonobacterales bacterium]